MPLKDLMKHDILGSSLGIEKALVHRLFAQLSQNLSGRSGGQLGRLSFALPGEDNC